jgi:hypothetical protein
MTPFEFYKKYPKDHLQQVAAEAGTTFSNLQQIALADGSVGKVLAEKLSNACGGEMSELEILYPERYSKSGAA